MEAITALDFSPNITQLYSIWVKKTVHPLTPSPGGHLGMIVCYTPTRITVCCDWSDVGCESHLCHFGSSGNSAANTSCACSVPIL